MKNACLIICLWSLIVPAMALSKDGSPVSSIHALSPEVQSVAYKTMASMRTRERRSVLILWVVIEPEDFVRDRMSMLARQLNRDFPDEQRIYAVFFDSEETARNYDPAGGSYSLAKKLERGEYNLDRARGHESINFSSRRGNPVDEITITLGSRFTRGKRKRR